MKRHLLAVALVTVLGTGGCSGGSQPTAGDASGSTNPSASGTPSAPATPSPSAAPTSTAATTTSQANRPAGGGAAPPPPPSAPPPDPNAAFCATFEGVLDRTFQLLGPAFIIENSADPVEVEQAWQDIQRIAGEAAALSRQAIGQTTDAYLKAAAQTLASHFDLIAAAATARDKAALDSIPDPGLPEPPDGQAICGF